MEDRKFNPAKKISLNDPNRLKNIVPEKIVEILGNNISGNLVDYGSGTAYITSYIADLLPETRIFALDIEEEMTNYVFNNLINENIFPLTIQDNEIPFVKDDLEAVWSIAVYHEMKNPQIWLRNVNNSLKKGGKVLIIDWSPEQNPEIKAGPPIHHRVNPEIIIKNLKSAGFENIETHQGFKNHFAISAIKN
ncbi:MAG: class I SAM-dependent methyltransferase [Bacteroidales bacterium]|jgi:SAM-dependent methyltransferase|nr:class I SAM-dependent methyltransferase [Bacteroidales bacterium]MCK9499304.1 class I SAM-dependent methyltransferase [Bacteroidales bacterium]MDY0313653.1 class I SAM-dependent methyltransferase [Bacteroidales bacterium]NLB85951.1 class I SAM-dependent methyltransferase [Bacteroidales bacterium]